MQKHPLLFWYHSNSHAVILQNLDTAMGRPYNFILVRTVKGAMQKHMKIVITAGGTSERIDDVRTITNSSTGSLGFAIGTAFAAEEKIEKIYYLHGKRAVWPEDEKVVPIEIGGVMDLKENLTRVLTEDKIDACIHAMAVSDYMVHQVTTLDKLMGTEDPEHAQDLSGNKISSDIDDLIIHMKRSPKVISIIKELSPRQRWSASNFSAACPMKN